MDDLICFQLLPSNSQVSLQHPRRITICGPTKQHRSLAGRVKGHTVIVARGW